MKLETFFNKFDELADTPDAVAKMRKLILTLAARGQLVEQREPEKPSGRVTEVSIHVEEPPYELPSGWVWKRLGDLADFIGGSQPPKSKFIYRAKEGYTRFVQIRDFKSDANLTFIPTALATRPFNEDDVMIGRYGPPVFQILRGLSGTYNVALIKAEPTSPSLTKDFLFYLLQEPRIQDRVIAESERTAGQSGVRKPLLSSFIIGLPPLAEQKRIVAKVDELMALCDRLEAQQQEREEQASQLARASLARFADAPTPANLDFIFHSSFNIHPSDLRKSILTLAVQGKLVPQYPNDEAVEGLLVTVERDKAEIVRTGAAKPFKHLLPVQENEVPNELPQSWKWVRTETICEAIVDCPHSTPVFIPSGIVCLDTNGFKEGQLIPHKIRFVSEETYEDRVRRLVPRAGDIVFAREGSVGASVIVPQNMRCCLGQRVMLFRLMSDISPRFFSMALSESSSLERLLALHKGIGAKHVNVADMRNALIPLPPLAEQRRIVAKVEQLMALVDALETQLATSRATAANLLSALVAELSQ